MVKLLHIGLGKCGSTFYKKKFFQKYQKRVNTNYINIFSNNIFNIKKHDVKYCAFENFKNIENLLPNDFILSNEGLFSKEWEFSENREKFSMY